MTRAGVVVTGIGTVGAFGAGCDALAAGLASGGPRLPTIEYPAGSRHPRAARRAALVDAAVLAPWLPAGAGRRMSAPSRFGVAAARMAFADAGLEPPANALTGCVLASAFGPTSFTEKLLRQILVDGPEMASPYFFTECVANAPAAQAAIAIGARGPNITVTGREAGPLIAFGRAARLVSSGKVARALAGTVEEMSPLLHCVLGRFRALAPPAADGSETARPFDARRDGLVAAEGATVLVLEDAALAETRGTTVLARVAAAGNAFDPTATAAGWGHDADRLARALVRVLDRAGLAPHDIDVIVSGASGTRGGDLLEGRVLRAVWPASMPPVVVPKGSLGEYGGAYVAAAALLLRGAEPGPPGGFAEPDPALGIVPHPGGALGAPRRVLLTSVAPGGAAAWLVLERP